MLWDRPGSLTGKDRFGVVRDPGEMRQLCTDEAWGLGEIFGSFPMSG